jgi:hypothetical protein
MIRAFILRPFALLLTVITILPAASSTTYAVTLEELMGAENVNTSEGQPSTGSLLDGVESGRMNSALTKLQLIDDQINANCACFQGGNCQSRWSIESSDKSRDFINKEQQLLEERWQACSNASNRMSGNNSSTDDIKSLIVSAQKDQTILQGVDTDMRALVAKEQLQAMDRSFLAELAQEDAKKARRAESYRQQKAQDARDRAELDRDWARGPYSNSDQAFWDGVQKTEDRTMRNIRSQKRAYNQAKNNQQQSTYKQTPDYSSSSTGSKSASSSVASTNTATTKNTATGPLITNCQPSNGGLVGPLENGKYCFTVANKNNRQCDSLNQSDISRTADFHCLKLNNQMKNSDPKGRLVPAASNRLSCECGVNKYGTAMCKSYYQFSCSASSTKGGSDSISK